MEAVNEFPNSLGEGEVSEMTSWKVMPITEYTTEIFLFGNDLIPLPGT